MSDINLQWLVDNLSNRDVTIFDIGCADVGGDAYTFKALFPNAEVYAFECGEYWRDHNTMLAEQGNIHYFHIAMADHTNGVTFYPSEKNNEEQSWPWSGSIYQPSDYLKSVGLLFGEGYTVPSTTLNLFCTEHNVVPTFIHIDAQGAEYSIFKDMTIRPEIIWAEISEFHTYETGTTYDNFNNLLIDLGYDQKYMDNHDALYVRNDLKFTDYTPVNK